MMRNISSRRAGITITTVIVMLLIVATITHWLNGQFNNTRSVQTHHEASVSALIFMITILLQSGIPIILALFSEKLDDRWSVIARYTIIVAWVAVAIFFGYAALATVY